MLLLGYFPHPLTAVTGSLTEHPSWMVFLQSFVHDISQILGVVIASFVSRHI